MHRYTYKLQLIEINLHYILRTKINQNQNYIY